MMTVISDKSNKEHYNWDIISRRLDKALARNCAYMASMELRYENAVPRLLIELPVEGMDYHDSIKVICRDGNAEYFVIDQNNNPWAVKKRNIYDRDWNLLPVKMKYPNVRGVIERPFHLSDVARMAEMLSGGFDFAVVHFWDTPSRIVFNKICFEIGGGVERISCNCL